MVRHWNTLPREFLDASSLEVSKARLDRAWNNLVKCKMSLAMAGGWNDMISNVPSNSNHSVITGY